MMTIPRRKFIKMGGVGILSLPFLPTVNIKSKEVRPLVISTWPDGVDANKGAWDILSNNGISLDAVEKGVRVIEDGNNCCVGLMGYPDRDGFVTLDASIMDDEYNCGAVAALERIKHPISVARLVMEKTPHVLLVGEGAQAFALQQGFTLEPAELSEDAKKAYTEWLKTSQYRPIINIEDNHASYTVPSRLSNGQLNHDTISMLALDAKGKMAASCTTSGMAFKMHGRVGDSPIIGAGIYVEPNVGAAASTGQGEDCIRIVGSYTVIEYLQRGYSPKQACKKAVEKIYRIKKEKAKSIQLAFIAMNTKGDFGAFALQKGFSYAVQNSQIHNQLFESDYLI